MIKHIVFWNFENSSIAREVVEKLETLPLVIDEIVDFEAAHNYNPSEVAFDVVLYSTFSSKADLDTYQNHPDHVAVAQFIGGVATKRAVVDYEIDGEE